MVHAAIHDAIQAYDRRFEPYHVHVQGASGSPLAAAAASAARDVLIGRLPGAAADAFVDKEFLAYLAANGLLATDPGVEVGATVAAGILAHRTNDGSFPTNPPPFSGGTGLGEWRPTTEPPTPMVASWLADVTPFTLKSASQLRASQGPPHLMSGLYARDYDEVLRLGGKNGSERTQEQTDLAMFYSDNFVTLLQRTLRGIADAHITNTGDSGRLFALANFAAADAMITAWDSKIAWNFWRPITAIHEGDNDPNPRTAGDSSWVPFLTTPNYPDYTSGANNVTSATMRTLELFFGTDEFTFFITSNAVNQTRQYLRFSAVADDVVDVRIYQGIHFRFADAVARRQGKRAADWAHAHFLRPLR
jgi:hypothetical protein